MKRYVTHYNPFKSGPPICHARRGYRPWVGQEKLEIVTCKHCRKHSFFRADYKAKFGQDPN